MKYYTNVFRKIISVRNLFISFDEFKEDKKNRVDVLDFEWKLEKNIIELNRDLEYHKYKHGVYSKFAICDPKPRVIHKACVRDRVLHHAVFRILNPLFEPSFISHSFSCRIDKGTHKGIESLATMVRKVSRNSTRPCFVLKCDIKKFFNSVNHQILLEIIKRKVKDMDFNWLIEEIVGSFGTEPEHRNIQMELFDFRGENREPFDEFDKLNTGKLRIEKRSHFMAANGKGIPIGNLTSQLFANVYMNEFDQFVKHKLKVKHYCRYTDDFVIVSGDRKYLEELLPQIEFFLDNKLKLQLHPTKISIRKVRQGIDFLGYVVLPHYRRVRTKTKNRIFKKLRQRIGLFKGGQISEKSLFGSLNSYLGVFSHANTHDLGQELLNDFWFWFSE